MPDGIFSQIHSLFVYFQSGENIWKGKTLYKNSLEGEWTKLCLSHSRWVNQTSSLPADSNTVTAKKPHIQLVGGVTLDAHRCTVQLNFCKSCVGVEETVQCCFFLFLFFTLPLMWKCSPVPIKLSVIAVHKHAIQPGCCNNKTLVWVTASSLPKDTDWSYLVVLQPAEYDLI